MTERKKASCGPPRGMIEGIGREVCVNFYSPRGAVAGNKGNEVGGGGGGCYYLFYL